MYLIDNLLDVEGIGRWTLDGLLERTVNIRKHLGVCKDTRRCKGHYVVALFEMLDGVLDCMLDGEIRTIES